MDLSKISTPDLQALQAGDLSRVSADGLAEYQRQLSGAPAEPPKTAENLATRTGRAAPAGVRRLANAVQGATFGFGDEIVGGIAGGIDAIRGGGNFRDNYEMRRDWARGAAQQYKDDNPTQSLVEQGLGALPTLGLGASARATQGATLMGRTALAARTGAVTGAISGAGTSTATDMAGVASDAAAGAGTGAVLAGATTPTGAVLGAVLGNGAQRLSKTRAADYARIKVAEAISRDARGVAAQAGGDPGAQALARMSKLGPEARVVDAAGQNTRQLLDTLATLPGRTKDATEAAILQRQAGRASRLITAADDSLGANGRRLSATVDDLMAQRQQAAAPLYARVHAAVVDQPSQALVGAVAAADALGATSLGRKMATASQQPFTLDLNTPTQWALRDLDHVKQGLDTMIQAQIGNTGKLSPLGAKMQGLKDALVRELDASTVDPRTGQSVYQAARAAYAGPSALITAAEAGRKALTAGEDGARRLVAGMGPSELDAFRVGVQESLRVKLGSSDAGRTQVLSMWKNPALRETLQVLFPDERAFRTFAARVAGEARMQGLEKVGRGSQTASRAAGMSDLDVAAMADMGRSVATGSPLGIAQAGAALWSKVATPEATRDAMGRMLLSRDPSQLMGLQDFITRINNQRAARAIGTGTVLGGAAGNLSGLLGP